MGTRTAPTCLRPVGKALLMPTVAVLFARGPRGPEFGRVVAAQALSWGGDLALEGRGRRPFLAGLGLFLAAHLSYVSAFRSRSSAPVLGSPGRRRFAAAGGLTAAGMAVAAGRRDRSLAVPVAAYGVVLTALGAAAAAIDGDRGRDRVLAGASLFLLSDALIGVRRFLVGDDVPVLGAAVMTSYAAAQWCISDGMRS